MSHLHRTTEENDEKYTVLCKKLLVDTSSAASLILCWNVWSILNETKLQNFLCILDDMNIELACVCETWFDSKSGKFSKTIKDAGYEIHHAFREKKRGGGAAMIYKRHLDLKEAGASSSQYSSLEYACAILALKMNCLCSLKR